MSSPFGKIVWHDLTVKDADAARSFYADVVGWTYEEIDMGGYSDYVAMPADGEEPAGGVCHARGVNANVPAAWLVYIQVENLEASLARVTEKGGVIVDGPREVGNGSFAIIRDPFGAYCGLIESEVTTDE